MGDASIRDQERGELYEQLDQLWVRHLDCLDRYQIAQNDLKKLMAAGHFSLAQANFKSPNRRPYGRDYYDERMKASTRVTVSEKGSDGGTRRLVVRQSGLARREDLDESKESITEPRQQPSPPSTPDPDVLDDNGHDNEASFKNRDEKNEIAAETSEPSRDPLRWFGILVPRDLRSAQTSFSAAVDGPLIEAANAARGMREVESEIRRARKAIIKAEKAGVGKISTG